MNAFMHGLSMGKYAAYVWSCYGLVVSVFLIHCLAIKWQKRRIHQQLQDWFSQSGLSDRR